jgi:hypothetical protein
VPPLTSSMLGHYNDALKNPSRLVGTLANGGDFGWRYVREVTFTPNPSMVQVLAGGDDKRTECSPRCANTPGAGPYQLNELFLLTRIQGREAPNPGASLCNSLSSLTLDYSMSHPSGVSSGTIISSVGVPLGTMKVTRSTAFLLLTFRNK